MYVLDIRREHIVHVYCVSCIWLRNNTPVSIYLYIRYSQFSHGHFSFSIYSILKRRPDHRKTGYILESLEPNEKKSNITIGNQSLSSHLLLRLLLLILYTDPSSKIRVSYFLEMKTYLDSVFFWTYAIWHIALNRL